MADDAELEFYTAAGMAALIPGMQRMLELMQRELDNLRLQLAAAQGRMITTEAPQRRGRPRKAAGEPVARLASGWPADPEERKREMARRIAKARGGRKSSAALSRERKAAWAALSPQEKRRRSAAMIAGKEKARRAKRKAERANARPVVTLEKTA